MGASNVPLLPGTLPEPPIYTRPGLRSAGSLAGPGSSHPVGLLGLFKKALGFDYKLWAEVTYRI